MRSLRQIQVGYEFMHAKQTTVKLDSTTRAKQCLFVCGISLTSGQLVIKLFHDGTSLWFLASSELVSECWKFYTLLSARCVALVLGCRLESLRVAGPNLSLTALLPDPHPLNNHRGEYCKLIPIIIWLGRCTFLKILTTIGWWVYVGASSVYVCRGGVCLFVCGISLTSGQLVSELFPDCTRSCFSQVVLRRRGGDRIYEMRCLFVAVGPNARFIVLPHWDNTSQAHLLTHLVTLY